MSIQNIGRNKWRVVVKLGRDPKTGKAQYLDRIVRGNKAAAMEYEAAATGTKIAPSRLTLGEFLLDNWLPTLELEAASIEYYQRGIANLQAIWEVALADLNAFCIESAFKDLPPGSVRRRAKKTLSSALNTASRWNLIAYSPLSKAQISIGKGATREYDAYNATELVEILDAFRGHNGEAVILAMAFGGLRKEEALALDWSDIDLESGAIHITKAWVKAGVEPMMKTTKTEGSLRNVFIGGYGLERLRELVCDGVLWCGKAHERIYPDAATRAFRRRIEACGLRYIPLNNLRHTNATISLANGIDVALVSKNLGHARVSTTVNAYIKPLEESRKDAATTFAQVIQMPKQGAISQKSPKNLGKKGSKWATFERSA